MIIMLGRSVSKIIIIVSFWVATSKTKNIDHRVKETYAIMSAQVTCETDHISTMFTRDSTMSCALNFCFLCISLCISYNLKE